MAKAILGKKKKSKGGGITLSDFKLYYKAMIIKNSLVPAENQINRWMEQNWEPRNTPMYVLTIKAYNKGVKNIQCRMDNLFNKWCWKNWADTCKKKKKKKSELDHCLIPCKKLTQDGLKTWMKYLEKN